MTQRVDLRLGTAACSGDIGTGPEATRNPAGVCVLEQVDQKLVPAEIFHDTSALGTEFTNSLEFTGTCAIDGDRIRLDAPTPRSLAPAGTAS